MKRLTFRGRNCLREKEQLARDLYILLARAKLEASQGPPGREFSAGKQGDFIEATENKRPLKHNLLWRESSGGAQGKENLGDHSVYASQPIIESGELKAPQFTASRSK